MKPLIYGLFDPRPCGPPHIRYVGFTQFGLRRVVEHLSESKKKKTSHRHRWIGSLVAAGIKPAVIELESVTLENWQERERFWISRLRHLRLVNATDGGDGLINPSPDVRAAISAKVSAGLRGNQRRKGIPHSDASKEAMREAARTSQKCKAMYANRKGKPGRTPSAATREKIRQSHLGVPCPWAKSNALNMSALNRGTFWANDGTVQRRLRKGSELPPGWVMGTLAVDRKTTENRLNAIRSAYARMSKNERNEKPRGSTAGMVWINNGIERKCQSKAHPIPEGWVKGVGPRKQRS